MKGTGTSNHIGEGSRGPPGHSWPSTTVFSMAFDYLTEYRRRFCTSHWSLC